MDTGTGHRRSTGIDWHLRQASDDGYAPSIFVQFEQQRDFRAECPLNAHRVLLGSYNQGVV